jgi:hypothetical protein
MSADVDDTAASGGNSFKLSDFLAEDGEPKVETVEVEVESEPEPVEEGETTEGDDAGENDTASEAEEEAKPRKGKSVQERFDRLAAEKHEALAEAAYLRGLLEARAPKEAEKQPEAELVEPDPEDYDFGEEDPAYRRALRKYDREAIRKEVVAEARALVEDRTQADRINSAASQLEQGYNQAVEAAREELPDYDAKVTEAAKRGEFPVTREMAALIKSSPVGPKVAYHLAENVEEALAVSEQPALVQAAYFGALAAKFADVPEKEPAKKVTSAPPPPKTLSRGSGGQFEPTERGLYRKMLKEFR